MGEHRYHETAPRAEYSDAGADMPEIEITFSGGNWDFSVYAEDEPKCAYNTSYFAIVR